VIQSNKKGGVIRYLEENFDNLIWWSIWHKKAFQVPHPFHFLQMIF
jgi:hypothetical protein